MLISSAQGQTSTQNMRKRQAVALRIYDLLLFSITAYEKKAILRSEQKCGTHS